MDELKLKEKTLKTSLGIFIGLLFVLAGAILFMFFKLKTTTVAVTPFVLMLSLIGLLFFNKKNLSDVQAEIQRRERK